MSSQAAASSPRWRPSSTPDPVRHATESPPSNPGWADLIASNLRDAQDQRQLDPHASIEQLTFEINALIAHANTVFLLQGDRTAFDLARRAIHDRLHHSGGA